MPRIYLTCRTEDTAHTEFEQVYSRLVQAFGEPNILRTAGSGSVDVLQLADSVRSCDALVVVTGRYWLNMLDESGKRLLDDPFDYLYTELNTALADDEKWVTLLLVDGTTAPEADELPEALRGLLRRDRVSVANNAELDAALDSLIKRIPMAGADKPEEEAHPAPVMTIQTDAPPPENFISEKTALAKNAVHRPPSPPGFPYPDEDIKHGCLESLLFLIVLLTILCALVSGRPPQ